MKRNYKRLALEDRKKMEILYNFDHKKPSEIAKNLGTHTATIYRELQRGKKGQFYDAVLAQENLKRGKKYHYAN